MTCDFAYVDPVGSISSFSYNTATKKLTIVGTDLPTSVADIASIEFAKTNCVVDSSTVSATGVSCTLETTPTCGQFTPIFSHVLGLIPVASGVASTSVTCPLTSVTASEH
jgi:hypothetical protein